jgi:uncharacterized protein YbjQ (UPF0145 family)
MSHDDTDDKKDITRIEDLSEFLHEDDESDEFQYETADDVESTLPDLPVDDIDNESEEDSLPDLPEEESFSNEEASFDSGDDFQSSEDFEDSSYQEVADFPTDTQIDPNENLEDPPEEDSFTMSSDFDDEQDESSLEEPHQDSFTMSSDFDDNFSDQNEEDEEPTFETLPDEDPIEEEMTTEPLEETSKTPLDLPETAINPEPQYQKPEDFSDLKKFAESLSYRSSGQEGTPPYSILISGIKYEEDADKILETLKEFNLVDEDSLESSKKTLYRGSFLVSRLSEFTAIKFLQCIRHLDLDYQAGLTEHINPPKSYESQDAGLSSKRSIKTYESHTYIMNKSPLELDQIMTSTMSQISGYEIMKYIGITSENTMIDPESLNLNGPQIVNQIIETFSDKEKQELYYRQTARENQMSLHSDPSSINFDDDDDVDKKDLQADHKSSLTNIYDQLVLKLKAKAMELNGNAVVGVNFNITPMPYADYKTLYQVTCTGNVVWVESH